jgi:hypothetical protein
MRGTPGVAALHAACPIKRGTSAQRTQVTATSTAAIRNVPLTSTRDVAPCLKYRSLPEGDSTRPILRGERGAWVKTKCLNRAEFAVVGW